MPTVDETPKWSVKEGTKWGVAGWLIFAPDGWANHLTATFAEAIKYAQTQAIKETP